MDLSTFGGTSRLSSPASYDFNDFNDFNDSFSTFNDGSSFNDMGGFTDVQEFLRSESPPQISVFLPQVTEDCAFAYFMSSYIRSSNFEAYLPDLFADIPPVPDAFQLATRAAALVTFAVRIRHKQFLVHARQAYALALAETNAAMASPSTAILDRTLGAVLLLTLYESAAYQGKASLENWTRYTFGMMNLLRMRRQNAHLLTNSNKELSKQLFIHVSYNVRTTCVQTAAPVPDDLMSLAPDLGDDLTKDILKSLGGIMDGVAALRKRFEETGATPDCVIDAIDLDASLEGLRLGIEDLEQDTIPGFEPDGRQLNIHVIYRFQLMLRKFAKYRNSIRMLRIYLNEFVYEHAGAVADELSGFMTMPGFGFEELTTAASVNVALLAKGLVNSVAFYKDPVEYGGKFAPSARVMFWPLAVLRSCPLCPPELYTQVTKYLDELATDLNFPHAAEAAKAVDGTRPATGW